MFCSDKLNILKSSRYRKVPVNDRWRLNNVHVIKHQRHSNIQNVNLYQQKIASQRKRQIVISRSASRWRFRTLDGSSNLDGGADGGVSDRSGWTWGETQPPVQLARSEASAFPDRRQRVLTTTRHARSRLLLVSQLPSDRLVHSTSVQSTLSSSTPTQLNRL